MKTLKTLMNVGMNTSNDYVVPVVQVLEKKKDYEVRVYETNKYLLIKYLTTEKIDENSKNESKTGNDTVTNIVWRLMKYTQGENDQNLAMKLIMPVFVHVETLDNNEESSNKDRKVEVKVMLSLPPEYQVDSKNPDKTPLDPPKPNDQDILFEVMDQFKCYVRTFGGFASDSVFKAETGKLNETLKQENNDAIKLNKNIIICIAYDPPFKLFGRRNEVLVPSL